MLLLLWKVEENVRERERWLCKTNRPRGALGDLVGFLGCSGSKMSLSPLLFLPLPLLCGWRWLLRPPFTLALALSSPSRFHRCQLQISFLAAETSEEVHFLLVRRRRTPFFIPPREYLEYKVWCVRGV